MHTFYVNEGHGSPYRIYQQHNGQETVCEPFLTQRLNFIVQPVGTFLAYTKPGFRRAHGEVFESVELAEHELGGLPAVHLWRGPDCRRVRSCPCGIAARTRSETCCMRGERHVALNGWNYQRRPHDTHFFAPLRGGPLLA